MTEINLKYDMPTVQEAVERLHIELQIGKASGEEFVKFIHGYGSSGLGGRIRAAVHKELRKKQQNGEIKGFAAGEAFHPFDNAVQKMVAQNATVARDKDFAKDNVGITVVHL